MNNEDIEEKERPHLPDNDYKLTGMSWVLTFFLCIVWPVGVILMFNLSDRSGDIEQFDRMTRFYLPTIATQLLILVGIYMTIRHENTNLKSVGFGRFKLVYIIDAILFQLLAWYILRVCAYLLSKLKFVEFYDTAPLFPASQIDLGMWLIMSAVAAVTEETAFRGYLLTRLKRITGLRAAAVLIATAAFSAGHLYQGSGGFILIFIYGLMFAALFFITRSIWPCVIAHFIHNAAAPVLQRFMN
jgi:membrane protease YdiL (CAAX protease family)